MPYTHTTFAQAKSALAARLGDTGEVFWSNAEKGIYIQESLRTWSAHTGYWRERNQFATTQGTSFYDLPTVISAQRGYNVTGQSLVLEILYHLLEPPTPTVWTGTEQFTLADVINAVQRRRDQFLVDTGLVISQSSFNTAATIGRQPLADTTIDVRRLSWTGMDGRITQLWRTDEWDLTNLSIHWPQDTNTPSMYSVSVTPPLTIQLAPPPLDLGTLQMLSVDSGAAVDVNAPNVLGIPDDFAWVVKWGALADLLAEDGVARDPGRAEYCEKRWDQGIDAARQAVSVVSAYINEVPVISQALDNVDTFRVDWQNTQGTPDMVAMGGLNLMALSYVPDGVYSVTVDVVRNAPLPVADGDFIQIGREQLDVILDYAQHMASFKQGGAEFEATYPLYQRFAREALNANARLRAASRFMEVLASRGRQEEMDRPRRKEALA